MLRRHCVVAIWLCLLSRRSREGIGLASICNHAGSDIGLSDFSIRDRNVIVLPIMLVFYIVACNNTLFARSWHMFPTCYHRRSVVINHCDDWLQHYFDHQLQGLFHDRLSNCFDPACSM